MISGVTEMSAFEITGYNELLHTPEIIYHHLYELPNLLTFARELVFFLGSSCYLEILP